MTSHKVCLYARISVSNEESVSVARQLESGRALAMAKGWEVVGEFVDDGVSASKNRPEDRSGWKALLGSPLPYDAIIVWKVDRLARRVLDFLHADEALQERPRPAGLVSVEEPIDMTTSLGRAFATMLAVFAELEAAAISARVSAAKKHLAGVGRWAGGTVPYGFKAVQREGVPGWYLEKDPMTIEFVEGAARLVLSGSSIYSALKGLEFEGAPLPTASQGTRVRDGWSYATVERMLRNPMLAGYTEFRGELIRGDDGLPRVDSGLAVLTTDERRDLMSRLDDKTDKRRQPRPSGVTSPLMAGLVTCGHCERTLTRGTTAGRPALSCPDCNQTISRNQLDPYVVERLLSERGDEPVITATAIPPSVDEAALRDVEAAIRETTDEMRQDDVDVVALAERLVSLKEARRIAMETPSEPRDWLGYTFSGQTVQEAWDAAGDNPIAQREVLQGQLQDGTFTVRKGKTGRYLDKARVEIVWAEGFPHIS